MLLRPLSGLRARLLVIVLLSIVPAVALLLVYAGQQNALAEQRAHDDAQRLLEADDRVLQDLFGQAKATLVAYSESAAVQKGDWATAAGTARRIKSAQPEYLNVGVAQAGRLVVSALPTTGTVDVRDRSYYQRALRYRQFAIGDYQVGKVSHRPSFSVAYPVLGSKGEVKAVTFAAFDIELFRQRLEVTGLPAGSAEVLMDSKGVVLVSLPRLAGVEGRRMTGSPLVRSVLHAGRGTATVAGLDKAERTYYFAPVFNEPDGGLYLALGFSPDVLLARDRRNLSITLGGLAATALLAAAIAWALATFWVYRPTRRLETAATSIGRGDLSARADLPPSGDEIGSLGREFDAMAATLETQVTALSSERDLSDRLNRINATLIALMDANEILERVLVDAKDALGAETAAVFTIEGDDIVATAATGFEQEIVGLRMPARRSPHGLLAIETKAAVAIDDALDDPRVERDLMVEYGIRSVLAIPLLLRDRPIGILYFNYHTYAVRFTREQIDFADKLAAALALALENARLHERERDIAETLQTSLLWQPDTIEGVEIGHVYRSASEDARVGGDFYDVFALSSSCVAIVVGDVSGKGVEAAWVTALARDCMRAHAVDGDDPAENLRKTNVVLHRFTPPEIFVTAFIGMLDLATKRLSYANGGHPAPLVAGPGGVVRLQGRDPLLGAFRAVPYEAFAVTLREGELVFMNTDGLLEARRGDGEMFGEIRVEKELDRLYGLPAREVAQRMFDAASSFAGGRLSDDVAILVVRPDGSGLTS